ncbi:MAG: HAD family hydrolase [Paracoccaceae bacterium]
MAIEAVVFDIGNVLLEWYPEQFYDRKIGAERRKKLFDEVDLEGVNRSVDLGAEMKKSMYELAEKHPEWGDEIRLWHDSWVEIASPVIDHSVQLLRALRAKGFPVFALTNFGVETFELAETLYPFFSDFDQRFVSGRLEVMKPDARIYEIVETEGKIAPENLLFTDDNHDNIVAANARGWQTHLFENPQGWADRLVQEGLLSEAEARA